MSSRRPADAVLLASFATVTSRAHRDEWVALGPPVEALAFDFYEWRANMAPAEAALRLQVTRAGVWNAVAFWFDLQLDEETQLSTSPHGPKVHSAPCL